MKVIEPGREQNNWATETAYTKNKNNNNNYNTKLLIKQKNLFKTYKNDHNNTKTHITFQYYSYKIKTNLPKNNIPKNI